MKTCSKCLGEFPSVIKIDGKYRNLANRKYCFACSPFKEHNTVPLHKGHGKDKIILNGECSKCGNAFSYTRNSAYEHKRKRALCNTCLVNIRRPERKELAVIYKGGKCLVCGYGKCVSALDFHHVEPDAKDFAISSAYLLKLETFMAELDKCVLVCRCCHSEIHEGLVTTDHLKELEVVRLTTMA